jgi:hypothetical protein
VKMVYGEITFKVKYRFKPEHYPPGMTEAQMLEFDRQQMHDHPLDFLDGLPMAGDIEVKLEIREEQ